MGLVAPVSSKLGAGPRRRVCAAHVLFSLAGLFLFTGQELRGMAKTRRIKVTESGQVSVVTFADSKIIDEAEIQELGQELYDLVERDNRKKIVLNFANVEFLSSAALGKLIGFDKRVKQHAAELILSNIRPEIYEVFAITKLTKLFQIKDDEADALAVL
jgi:anti-sigma B factor antagonist